MEWVVVSRPSTLWFEETEIPGSGAFEAPNEKTTLKVTCERKLPGPHLFQPCFVGSNMPTVGRTFSFLVVRVHLR